MALRFPSSPTGQTAKRLGAYYTDLALAGFLVRWALRTPTDKVLDPAFGGGVFLWAADEHLRSLGGAPEHQVFGVELDTTVHTQTSQLLAGRAANLLNSDFFDLEPGRLPPMQAVVGNPPFIRYQRFSSGRERAIRRAASQGVGLSRLASSWAAFVVHSLAFLEEGGRLALVLPLELGHAAYARPVLEYLARAFERVELITFRKRLFPHLSQDCLLLLAEGHGLGEGQRAGFYLRDLESAASLEGLPGPQALDTQGLSSGQERLSEYWISRPARELYRELRDSAHTVRLGELAGVGTGYVTGANDYFHLSPQDVRQWDIPAEFLKPAIRRGRSLVGLRFTQADWEWAVTKGEGGYLLHIPPGADLPESLWRYLQAGQAQGVHQAYKCRVRDPWYSVPQVYCPDAFLSYMSGAMPSLVANQAGVVAPNSLHILRLRQGSISADSAEALACLWQTSLTRLSAELEGHAMGGGMLKIEPSEAERIVLARSRLSPQELQALGQELDLLLRAGKAPTAQELADQAILRGMGLEPEQCRFLREAATLLKERRYNR